jgi:F-type H+-transporting ATPase subunit b
VQIDWLTLAAQVVNFVILLVLLHRFLYRPIMGVMAEREQEIADRLEAADEAREKADAAAEEAEAERRDVEERRDELLDEARQEAAERRDELLEQARREVEEKKGRWLRSVEKEQEDLSGELERRVAGLLGDALENALRDLAGEDLEREVQRMFLKRLDELDEDRRSELREATGSNGRKAVVRSSFEPADERRQELEDAITELLGDGPEIRFEVDDELIAGIEVAAGDRRIAWSVRDYLRSLEEAVLSRLRETAERGRSSGGAGDAGGESAEAT